MGFDETREKLADLITGLYDSKAMDFMDLEYLELQSDRYPNSRDLLKLMLNLNSEYVKTARLVERESVWDRMVNKPDDIDAILKKSDIYGYLTKPTGSQSVMTILENLSNAQIYTLSDTLKEKAMNLNRMENNRNISRMADQIAKEIDEKYANQFGIRASNMKDIGAVFGFINDPGVF